MDAISVSLPLVTGPALIGLIVSCLLIGVLDFALKAAERRFFPVGDEV